MLLEKKFQGLNTNFKDKEVEKRIDKSTDAEPPRDFKCIII